MKHFKVKSLAVSGRGKKVFKSGDKVTEDDFVTGRAVQLVKEGHLEEISAPNEEKGASSEMNATEVIDQIQKMETSEAIDEFILGDERKTVIAAATDKKEDLDQ